MQEEQEMAECTFQPKTNNLQNPNKKIKQINETEEDYMNNSNGSGKGKKADKMTVAGNY